MDEPMSDPEEATTALQRVAIRNLELENENALLRDKLFVAQRRIGVLRGADVLTTASSRGVIIWLKAILEGVESSPNATKRHLNALIETLRGDHTRDGGEGGT